MPEGELKPEEEQEPEKPERTSGLMRVAGASLEEEQTVLKDIEKEVFNNQEILELEREKTPEELEIIGGILAHLPEFVKKYGGKPAPLRPEHIHTIDYNQLSAERKEKLEGVRGKFHSPTQSATVFVDKEEENTLSFAFLTTHELLHFSAFQSVDIHTNSEKNVISDRVGGFIRIKNGKEAYFADIDEAVTEELLIRLDDSYFKSLGPLSGELAQREESRSRLAKKHPEIDPDEVKRKIANHTTVQLKNGPKAGMWRSRIEGYKYSEEREKLKKIINDIQEKNPQRFKSSEAVFDVFARAYFTGETLEIGRLIEGTYGKGSFRRLGEETKAKAKKPSNS